MRPVLSEGHI